MNRHEYRVQIVFALYQHLLLNNNLNSSFNNNFEDDNNEFLMAIKNDLLNNINSYKEEINSHLNRWTFDRLSYIDQGILLEAYSEIKLGLNNKNIVINEAIEIAKDYSETDSFKYINGVLDNL